jgi:hypothetical protein
LCAGTSTTFDAAGASAGAAASGAARTPRPSGALDGLAAKRDDLREGGVDLGSLSLGLGVEDADGFADHGDLHGAPSLEEVPLGERDDLVRGLGARPQDRDADGRVVGLHEEPLLHDADERAELLLVAERAGEHAHERILAAEQGAALSLPPPEQIGLADDRGQVVVAEDHVGGRAGRRVGVVRDRATRVAERRDHQVALREDLGVDLVRAGRELRRGDARHEAEQEDGDAEALVPKRRSQGEAEHLPDAHEIGRLGRRRDLLGRCGAR